MIPYYFVEHDALHGNVREKFETIEQANYYYSSIEYYNYKRLVIVLKEEK